MTAITANLLTVVLYLYSISVPAGSGAPLVFSVFEMPLLWITCLISATILALKKRRLIFKRPILKWTILLLLFCTPIPLSSLSFVLNYTDTYEGSSGYKPRNGVTIKDEEWFYTVNHKMAIHKFFKLNREDYTSVNDSLFRKDSVWVYLSPQGDTTKLEQYKNGVMVSTINKKVSK